MWPGSTTLGWPQSVRSASFSSTFILVSWHKSICFSRSNSAEVLHWYASWTVKVLERLCKVFHLILIILLMWSYESYCLFWFTEMVLSLSTAFLGNIILKKTHDLLVLMIWSTATNKCRTKGLPWGLMKYLSASCTPGFHEYANQKHRFRFATLAPDYGAWDVTGMDFLLHLLV